MLALTICRFSINYIKNNISKAKWKKSFLTVSELLAAGNFNIIEGR